MPVSPQRSSAIAGCPPPIGAGLWYLLSSFAVISYTDNWFYVIFAAIGSWLGAFISLSFQRPTPTREGLSGHRRPERRY